MSIERFQACLAVTLEFEGGYSDDANDAGGATNLGIEFSEWNAWKASHGWPESSLEDFKTHLTAADVAPIYLQNYWEPINDGTLPHPVDMVAFDAAVNEGVGKAKQFLTETEDVADASDRACAIQALRVEHYNAIVMHNPSQHVFLAGWLGRVNTLTYKIQQGWI